MDLTKLGALEVLTLSSKENPLKIRANYFYICWKPYNINYQTVYNQIQNDQICFHASIRKHEPTTNSFHESEK